MHITVTQLPSTPKELEISWNNLVTYVKIHQPEIVLLPEMVFSPWLAGTKKVSDKDWLTAIKSHQEWNMRLKELGNCTVLGSAPVLDDSVPYNRSFASTSEGKYLQSHRKHYLPNEPGFWEAEWYRPAPIDFNAIVIEDIKIGYMICTDLWFTEHARDYARQGVQILANPRASEKSTVERWIVGGKAAAIMSGAYCISSNQVGMSGNVEFGGTGWIIDPNGSILALTSEKNPFVTVEINVSIADAAKTTYPRDVLE